VPDVDVVLQGFHLGSDQGRFGLAGVYLIRGSRTVLVDTAHVGRRELLLRRLAELDVRPADIDVVVITHAHWDHALNVDLFPNAEVLLHPDELSYIKSPHVRDWATPPWMDAVLSRCHLGEAVDGLRLAEGVSIIATPGHTWGSVSVGVLRGDTKLAIVGDALPNARSALLGNPYNVFADDDDAVKSLSRLVTEYTEFYPGHDRPFSLLDGKVTYLADSQLNVHGSLDTGDSDVSVRIAAVPPPKAFRLLSDQGPGENQ
jgi:N-acyl homoserine lactone hydrolase